MKKPLIVISIILVASIGYINLFSTTSKKQSCAMSSFKSSQKTIAMSDYNLMKIRMGPTFGKKLKYFKRRMKSAEMGSHYSVKKSKPWMTYFSTSFKSHKMANKAYRYLKKRVQKNSFLQSDVLLKGRSVTVIENSRLPKKCFAEVVANEKGGSKEKTKLAGKTTKKPTRSKKVRRRKKTKNRAIALIPKK